MDGLLGELVVAFEEMGVTINEPVLDRCVEICQRYNVLEAEEFVATWMAYSLSKLQGADPTVAYLDKFERDEYRKKGKENRNSQNDNRKSSLVIYEARNKEVDVESDSIMKVYDENAAKGKISWGAKTPDHSRKPKSRSSPQAVFSPASFSPTITSLSSKYTSRTNSGEVVFPYKNASITSDKDFENFTLEIERLNSVDIPRYMNFDLVEALDYADEKIDQIGNILMKKYHMDEVMPVRYKHPSPFLTIGRIACDADGRLNSKSAMLEGSRDLSFGETIQLDLGNVEKYSVFPGQIVAVEGVNITGDKLMAKQIYCDASPDPDPTSSRGPLSLTIAAGPFTQSDSMTYQPLLDLIEKVSSEEPDLLILTGPFIDSTHPVILENSLAETYQELFRKIVDLIMRPLQSKKTQVVMVSSYKDCNSQFVYPTPQLPLKDRHYQNLHLLPDPSIFKIGGVSIGVTSTDILLHIGKEEISSPGYSTDRLSRLSGHILSQRCFYPLTPATDAPVDPSFMEFAKLTIRPDILILPSDLRYFIKVIKDVILLLSLNTVVELVSNKGICIAGFARVCRC
ncbi:UNVERIFIED_CONTAM: hypothetical protein PYX00_007603 [Menopon gallinae]|uniref:DNA polymerase alpha subunit B n=1 Tax=Menopon gallinae TaxID=328185 RepID=A0AAW2HJT5_9NEOP